MTESVGTMRAALTWIADIADRTYEQDHKLRADGARQFKRIGDRARAALAACPENPQETTNDR